VSVVGAGRVGSAIGVALSRAGYPITAAWSRSRAGRQRVHRLLDVPVLDPAECVAAADITFVTVPDDAIIDIVELLAPAVRLNSYVIHTSGGTSISSLDAAKRAGAKTGCLHPLQTIPDATRGAEALEGASVAVTTDAENTNALMRIARAWGGKPFLLDDENKRVYHAAAVFASNYAVSTIWAATTLLSRAGIKNAGQLLGPLVRASVDNALNNGGRKAITGPVVRGDTKTVKQHITALKELDPAIANGYRAFAEMTEALVRTA
jgi:predicted short-subunit dehydrogenase-like oxidoreductase (DUF2520 family)